ncbi:MAG: RDD family protein [Bacteroidales bacterium]
MNYNIRHEFYRDTEITLATIKKRFVAFIIDCIVLIILYYCIIIVFRLFNMNISNINVISIFDVEIEMSNTPLYLITFLKILLGLLPVLYFTFSFYFCKGQSIGKYFLRLKVISLYHEHLGIWHCTERSLGYFASFLEFGFGFIQAFWNPNRMTLHDKIGETIVIELPVKNK